MKRSFLIDVNGVLYTKDEPIPGAAETLEHLRSNGYGFRLLTNATQKCRKSLHRKLLGYGFDVKEKEIFSAPVATARYIRDKGKRKCFLLTTGDVYKDFEDADIEVTEKRPDYVAVGDAGKDYTYDNMNMAFKLLLKGARLVAMEKDRYWMAPDGLALCTGPYVSALEYATGKKAVVTGKPSERFLRLALADMNARPEETIAIGDDLHTDVAGAQKTGMRAFLVKTGKSRSEDIKRSSIRPDAVLESIADLKRSSSKYLKA
ncbi:MAG: TIGR01458 family HAD-type hydrolase [Candidatus Altiarchaeota archaeon]|nr:TIGR01458 family HAD-type hydrolase [Candidatus Altiarchaeota archaeon]